jgi:hypothetical protein
MMSEADEIRARRDALNELKRMSRDELFGIAVRAGIYTKDGQLTAPYRSTPARKRRPARTKKR